MNWLNECTSIEEVGGRHRAVIGVKPRAYLSDGSWRAMQFRLGNTGDPVLPFGVNELLALRLANNLAGQSPTVHVGRGQNHIRMTAIGTRNVPGSVVNDGTGLPIGRRYNGAWTGADLEYLAGGHYLRKNVYLKAGHPAVFEFRIDGLAGTLSPSLRGWDLLDDAGRPVLWAGAGYLYRTGQPEAQTVPVPTTMRVQGGKSIYRYELPVGDWSGWILEPTWTSQPGAAEGLDTYLYQGLPDTNFGTDTTLSIGESSLEAAIFRSLIKFDQSGIPSNAVISSASLELTLTQDGDFRASNNRTANVFRSKRAWVEAQATYNSYSTGNAWATAGGMGAADYDSTSIGSCAFATTDLAGAAKTFALTGTTKTALDLGNGWIIAMQTETNDRYDTASSDNATAADRPSLTAVYSLPGGGIGRGRIPVLSRGGW